jgi:hypothetical protein
MKNDYKDIFKFLEENDLDATSRNIRVVEEMDLNDGNTVLKAKEIINRYENNPNKYSEDIMTQLRQRRGLDKYDISEDGEINNMSKDDVFYDLFGWNGLRGWDSTIKEWVEQVYGVKLVDE